MREITGMADVAALRASGVRDGLVAVVEKTVADILAAYEGLGAEWDADVEGPVLLAETVEDVVGVLNGPLEYAQRFPEHQATLVTIVRSNSYAESLVVDWALAIPQALAYELADLDTAARSRAAEG